MIFFCFYSILRKYEQIPLENLSIQRGMQNGNQEPPHLMGLQAMFCITPLATVWVHAHITPNLPRKQQSKRPLGNTIKMLELAVQASNSYCSIITLLGQPLVTPGLNNHKENTHTHTIFCISNFPSNHRVMHRETL